MRFVALIFLVLTACIGSASELGAIADDDPSPTDPGQAPNTCRSNDDCVLAGATCCDCPTFARTISDPKTEACAAVDCDNDTSACPTNVEAACDQTIGSCVLACAPLACLPCPNGYFTEANGCLSCTCAAAPSATPACSLDADCSRVRADCCGCPNGGEDTAVATADAAAFDQSLNCTSSSQCPGQSNEVEETCGAEFLPRCVNGGCELLDADMPQDACGPTPCANGETCTINVSAAANQYGLGICL